MDKQIAFPFFVFLVVLCSCGCIQEETSDRTLLEGTYPGASGDSWCDTDYAKRIDVNVDNTAGSALTDHEVYVNLTTNPINETSIRAHNATDCTRRQHWCENETGGNCYGVWINYSAVAGSSWTNNTAIYYNNDDASSTSNGTATFGFFDDFEDGDTSDWTNEGANTIVVNSTVVKAGTYSGKATGMGVLGSETYRTFTVATEKIFEYDVYFDMNTAYIYTSIDETAGSFLDSVFLRISNAGAVDYYDGSYHNIATISADQWYKFKIKTNSPADTFDIWIDSVSKGTGLGTRGDIDTGVRAFSMSGGGYAGGILYFDNIFSRVYTSTEPSVTLGSEESLNPGLPVISNEQPTSPITKSAQATNFEINATINFSTNNSWEIDRTGSYEHLEWDNGTTSPAYTFSPQTEGEGTYKVKLTAYNTTDATKNSSTTWDVTVANISLSSSSPGVTDTKYVSNKTVTWSATVNRTADCKWSYQNGTLVEWDNSTVSPSMGLWINSSVITAFNISLTAYDVNYATDNDTILWNNSITDDVFDYNNYTWSRLSYQDGRDYSAWTGLAIGGDVDNDGTDEFCAFSRINSANGTIIIQELDGTYRIYDSLQYYPTVYDATSLHDVDGDGEKELIGNCNKDPSGASDPYSSIYTFNATSMNKSNVGYYTATSNSNYMHGMAWFNISGVESYYGAGCGQGEITRVTHNYTAQSKQEIDNYGTSGDGTMSFDLDGDGQDELLGVEGWATNAAKVWAYVINTTDGTYDSKTLLFDNDLSSSQHFSVELYSGDIDNDGINNLILVWLPSNTWCSGVGKIEAYEWNVSNYGEGNYTEGFEIDNTTANSDIGMCLYGRRWAVDDADNDGLNEFIFGTTSRESFCGDIGGHLWQYDIGTDGATINRTTLASFSSGVYFGGYELQTLNPVIISDGTKNRIVVGVMGNVYGTNTQWTDIFLLSTNEVATTPVISNVQNGSISPTSQYVGWDVNQTVHNRVLYSNESDLTPAYYSSWDNSTALPNITLSGLTASTQYWYQAWSYNTTNNSLSDNSSTLSFTTAAVDTSFTVTLPSGYTYLRFEPTNATATNVTPNGQTDLQEFYNVTNTGDVNLDVRLQLNETVANIILKADSDNNPIGAKEVNTTLVTIHSNLAIANTADIWLWSDFNYAVQQDTNKTISINVTQSP